jgi:general secretion pathway protein A
VRLLTNLETNQRKLLQIIMLGQPELKNMLARPELRQLSQRTTARYHLGPLIKKEVSAYVNHRLAVAGTHKELFPSATINKLSRLSGGIPRLINLLCDRALLGAYAQGKDYVDKPTLAKAAREIFGEFKIHKQNRKTFRLVLASLILIGCVAALASFYYNYQPQPMAKITPRPVQQASVTEPIIEHPRVSSLDWPDDEPINSSKEIAYQSLLKQWGFIYKPNNGSVCQQAEAHGLRCLDAQGSLSNLLRLNRPAVLRLFDDQGRKFYATLKALRGQTAIFVVGTKTRTVDVKDIALRWLGDYTLLWRTPLNYQVAIKPGDQGPVVQWIDKQLAIIQKRTAQPRKNVVFDDELVRQVKKFQLAEGLVPDGIVGPQTLIHLNTAAGSSEPLLTQSLQKM